MLDFLKGMDVEGVDAITFSATDDDNVIHVGAHQYSNPGKPVGEYELGEMQHIILYKFDKEGSVCNIDHFEAILTEPLEYISDRIKEGWYGAIARKTTTSHKFADNFLALLKAAS